jgi:hypothetical protein
MGWNTRVKGRTLSYDRIDSVKTANLQIIPDAAVIYIGWDKYYTPTSEQIAAISTIDSVLLQHYSRKEIAGKYLTYTLRK